MIVGLKNLICQNLEENEMKKVWGLLLLTLLSNAENLDMFDIVDNDVPTNESVSKSHADIRIKLSHLIQNDHSNQSVLYANISDNKENYAYDVRIEANEDIQSIHIKDLFYKTSYKENYFFELGRMNVKEGIAYGYNPTDYFKGGSSFTLSVDPKEKKENRLGALLVQASAILDDVTIKALYSPKISAASNTVWANKKYFGLHLFQSNSQERASFYVGYTGFDDFSISGLLHTNDDGLNIGLNLSYVDENIIWYMESSTVKKRNTMDTFTDTLPMQDIHTTFHSKDIYRTELSLGINYTSEANIITTFEYIYNQAGMDHKDWENYFNLSKKNLDYTGIMMKIRGEILESSKLLSKHTLFMMVRQSDAWTNLDWSMLSWINPVDKSSLIQLGISYEYKEILFSLDARAYVGKQDTEYGSYPNDYEGLLSMTYFF